VDALAIIEKALVTAFPGAREPILKPDEAKARARIVHEDMTKVRFDLQLEYWNVELPGHQPIGVPAYKLIGSQFNPDAPLDEPDVYKAAGPGLNCGHLLRLSKACKLEKLDDDVARIEFKAPRHNRQMRLGLRHPVSSWCPVFAASRTRVLNRADEIQISGCCSAALSALAFLKFKSGS